VSGFDEALSRGAMLFDARRYFEAHEAWEAGWLACERGTSASNLLQGLIQCAAACLKLQRGEGHGARSLSAKGTQLLEATLGAADMPLVSIDLYLFVQRMRAVFAQHEPMPNELPKLLDHGDPGVLDRHE
jgi:predicted metal-dependent hydrolase